mmetsp:Transcript_18285/g.54907  ORF Transcript_18285/g.54907 Transcript_18285/m.54907 type:complete len:316 (+) Transcript_18285:835-1782(+)
MKTVLIQIITQSVQDSLRTNLAHIVKPKCHESFLKPRGQLLEGILRQSCLFGSVSTDLAQFADTILSETNFQVELEIVLCGERGCGLIGVGHTSVGEHGLDLGACHLETSTDQLLGQGVSLIVYFLEITTMVARGHQLCGEPARGQLDEEWLAADLLATGDELLDKGRHLLSRHLFTSTSGRYGDMRLEETGVGVASQHAGKLDVRTITHRNQEFVILHLSQGLSIAIWLKDPIPTNRGWTTSGNNLTLHTAFEHIHVLAIIVGQHEPALSVATLIKPETLLLAHLMEGSRTNSALTHGDRSIQHQTGAFIVIRS